MIATVRLIGQGIKKGSQYGPIRHRAATLAAKAKPKDYYGQCKSIFEDFVQRWRYVRDPLYREMVTIDPYYIYNIIMGGDKKRGVGDCDDATIAMGAQLVSIGIPVRICTIAPLGAPSGRLMTHVFPQAQIPGMGWVTVDPVVYPNHGFGYCPPHSRMMVYNLDGKIIKQYGNLGDVETPTQIKNKMEDGMLGDFGEIDRWDDYAGLGDFQDTPDNLLDFRRYGISDFGIYADQMGMMGGFGLMAEVDTDENGLAWTPALELAPHDYDYLAANGSPYHGMLALGDNGEVYQYDGLGNIFKKLRKKAKKMAKRLKKVAKKAAKKVLAKIPGGKYLLKLGRKLWKISKKLVRPLAKFVGKYAAKLAPIAAMIPGYGPAIAAGLHTAGKIGKMMTKYGAALTGKKGKVRKLKFKSDKHAQQFQKALKKNAQALKEAQARKKSTRAKQMFRKPARGGKRMSRRSGATGSKLARRSGRGARR